MKNNHQFSEEMLALGKTYDLRTLFEDFLAFVPIVMKDGKHRPSRHELSTVWRIAKAYHPVMIEDHFDLLLQKLIEDMNSRRKASLCVDVLGEFYEERLNFQNPIKFMPWDVCLDITAIVAVQHKRKPGMKILDIACVNGRLLLAVALHFGMSIEFFAITSKEVLAKMASVNFLLNGMLRSEVLVLDRLDFGNFIESYHITPDPLGIRRIAERRYSPLWKLYFEHLRDPKDFPSIHADFERAQHQVNLLFF